MPEAADSGPPAGLDLASGEVPGGLEHFQAMLAARPQMPANLDVNGSAAILADGAAGVGLALALARAGVPVSVIETDVHAAERAETYLQKLSAGEGSLALVRVGTDIEMAGGAGLLVDMLPEGAPERGLALAQAEALLADDAIILCTATMQNPAGLGQMLARPERLLLANVFAPAHRSELAEIAPLASTAPQMLQRAQAWMVLIGKRPVLTAPRPGLIAGRLTARLYEAVDHVLIHGTTPWELDEAMEDFGCDPPPCAAQDLSGLDQFHAHRQGMRPLPISGRMLQEGRLGRKVGVGWYRYPGGGGAVVDPLLEDMVTEEAYFAKMERQEYLPGQIRARLVLAMINAAAEIRGDGDVAAGDIDLVSVLGLGFPRSSGGVLHFADRLGAARLVAMLEALEPEDAGLWRPAAYIRACAQAGRSLSS